MNKLGYIIDNQTEFLEFLKSKFSLYHASNVFFRDFHYGIMAFAEEKMNSSAKYLVAEELARQVTAKLEEKGILSRIDPQTWLLNYPEFALPKVVPAPKPTPAAAPKVAVPIPAATPASV